MPTDEGKPTPAEIFNSMVRGIDLEDDTEEPNSDDD